MKKSFLNNIRRGLGSAYIELRDSSNRNEYLDTLIFACTHDSSYTLMTEGPKGQYLFSLIQLFDADMQKEIEQIIIESLSIKDSRALLFQKLDILESYFYEVDKNVAEVILNFCNRFMNETKKWDKHRQFAFEIVAIIMDRLFGLEQTKNILKFIHDKKFNVDNFGWYFYRLKAKYKKSEYINKLIDKDTIIEEKEKTVFTLERLLACDDKVYISLYGNRVDEKEFNNTISYLKTTNNIDHIKKILSAYSEKCVSGQLPVDLCFRLLDKYGEIIEYDVFNVIENYRSPLVEDLAIKLINKNKYLSKALTMLFNNYSKKHLNLIVDAYKKIKFSFYEYNSITYETINFMNHTKKNYPDDILMINYKKSYDSFFREYIVNIMKKRNLLTPLIIEECQYDFDYELNKKAKKWKYFKAIHNL